MDNLLTILIKLSFKKNPELFTLPLELNLGHLTNHFWILLTLRILSSGNFCIIDLTMFRIIHVCMLSIRAHCLKVIE